MTMDSLKQACDSINVTFNGNLLFYHKEIVGRYYHKHNEVVCDVISIGTPYPIEDIKDENETMKWLTKAIKYFKKLETEKRIKRIENDF